MTLKISTVAVGKKKKNADPMRVRRDKKKKNPNENRTAHAECGTRSPATAYLYGIIEPDRVWELVK